MKVKSKTPKPPKPPKGYRLLRVGEQRGPSDIRYKMLSEYKWGPLDSYDKDFIGLPFKAGYYPWARRVAKKRPAKLSEAPLFSANEPVVVSVPGAGGFTGKMRMRKGRWWFFGDVCKVQWTLASIIKKGGRVWKMSEL